MSEDIKQTIVVRHDLHMRMGKVAAQAAHASMMFMTKYMVIEEGAFGPPENMVGDFNGNIALREVEKLWLEGSFKKICLRVESEEELIAIHQAALDAGLVSNMCTDSGLTEFAGVPTRTCIAIGPDYASKIDPITKDLKTL